MSTQKSRPKRPSRPVNKINKQREIEQKRRKKRKTTLVVILIIIVTGALGTYLSISPTFKIEKISVRGNEQLTKEKVQELAGIKKGDNIFSKVGKVLEVKLKQNGCIEEAKVIKVYPNTIEIEITERKKQFQIKTETGNYIYIDEQGYILDCSTEKQELPTITGMDITETEAINMKRL